MSNPARRKGKEWEHRLIRYFRSLGLKAEGLREAGQKDEGDIAVVDDDGFTYLVEAKAERGIDLSGYVTQAKAEAANYEKARGLEPGTVMPIVIVKRRNHGVERAYVVTEVGEFFAPD